MKYSFLHALSGFIGNINDFNSRVREKTFRIVIKEQETDIKRFAAFSGAVRNAQICRNSFTSEVVSAIGTLKQTAFNVLEIVSEKRIF